MKIITTTEESLFEQANGIGSKPETEDKTIIFLTDYYEDFLIASKINKDNPADLNEEKVKDLIMNKYFSTCEYPYIVEDYVYDPAVNKAAELQKTIDGIKDNYEIIIENVFDALKKSRSLIENDDVSVYILPANPDKKHLAEILGGVLALCGGSREIVLLIDTEIKGWLEMLKYSVVHEYHHVCWTRNNYEKTTKWTLIDYLVFEGRADSFAHLVYPEIHHPPSFALSEEEKSELWNKIKGSLETTDFLLQREIMFGSENYPHWGGYTLGYDIVQKFLLENKDISADNWTDIEGETIFLKVIMASSTLFIQH